MKCRSKWNQNGLSLIDILIAMGIAGLVTMLLISVIPQSKSISARSNQQASLLLVRQQLFATLSRYEYFQFTLNAPENGTMFNCIKAGTRGACPASNGNFAIRRAASPAPVWYNPTNAAAGFNYDGSPCSPLSPGASPKANCPIRVDLSWTAAAPGCSTCNPSMITITARFRIYDAMQPDSAKRVRDASAYDFSLIKNSFDADCFIWGLRIISGERILAYQNFVPPCVHEWRTCTNGEWSGSFIHQACHP